MPSRPVLIGRGLVPHPHTNTNMCEQTAQKENNTLASTTQHQTTHPEHQQQNKTNPVTGLPELRRPQRQGNTRTHPEPGS
jgi:hypothetical protein